MWFAWLACTSPPPPSFTAEGLAALPSGFAPARVEVRGTSIAAITPLDDAGDVWITPGLIDAHAHPAGLGLLLGQLDLGGTGSYAEALARIAAAPAGAGWLQGFGWDQSRWTDAPPGGWPTAADLDARWPDRPVRLSRVDGHVVWVNAAALRAARVDAATPDPPGGRILRGPDGAPTGILLDNAAALVPAPPPAADELDAALLAAQDVFLRAGLVGVHDVGVDDATLAAYRRLEADGRLRIHVAAFLTADGRGAEELLARGPSFGPRLAVVGVKVWADGALGSRGALLSSPYADDPTSGRRLTPVERVEELAIRCLRARLILAVHAIGDRAVTESLDAFAAARAAVPEAADVPLRIEHAQVVRPEDRPRFAALNVIASMQPTHATSDMGWAEARLGPERIGWAYAWQDLAAAGARLAFGSDLPVESAEPARGLWAAVRRQDLAGQPPGGWRAEEAVTLFDAVEAFSAGAWAAEGRADRGGLAVGAAGTLTVWAGSVDPGVTPPGLRPLLTVLDGEVVWGGLPL